MKTTVLVAGLVAALTGTAVLAQVAATPDDSATAAPETTEEVEARKPARFAQADADGDGGLSAGELVALEEIIRDETRELRAAAMVERMDDNGDDLLQSAEIEERTPRLQPLFDSLDTSGDGAISEEELDAAPPMRGEGMGPMGRGHGGHGGRGGHGG